MAQHQRKGHLYAALAALKAKQLKPDLVFGRNTVGCALAAFAGLPVIFESHAPIAESGRLTSWFFDKLSYSKNLKKFVVITHSLKEHYLSTHPHLADKIHVAPDGADPVPPDIEPVHLPNAGKRMQVGYVGHLYKGKGMEVVSELASRCSWADFHVVGGLESDIAYWKEHCSKIENIEFHGYVPSREAISYQKACDVLLLPNQEKVNAHGSRESDIGSWTSPLKLFEYMAVQKLGRGIERITQACEEEGYPRPLWQLEPGGVWVTFSFIEEQKSQPRKTSEGVSEGVSEQEKILLELIGSHPGKRTPYYAEQMQTSRKNVERWLKPLRDNKHVEFKGSPRMGGYWLVIDD